MDMIVEHILDRPDRKVKFISSSFFMSYHHLCCNGSHDHAPEKIRKLMLDEPSICTKVLPLGNIYYHFSWLDKNRQHLVYIPDGEMKSIIMPMLSRTLLDQVIKEFSQEYPLLSGSISPKYSYHPHAKILAVIKKA